MDVDDALITDDKAGNAVTVLRGDPLLRQVKGLLVNQRLMGIVKRLFQKSSSQSAR